MDLIGVHPVKHSDLGFNNTLFGGKLRTRKIPNQRGEIYAKSMALNKMTGLGMPKGRWVRA